MSDMLRNRREELKKQLAVGETRRDELQRQLTALNDTMLRIAGAIQVLDELIAEQEPNRS